MQKNKGIGSVADQESEEHALNQKHYDLTRLFDRPNQSKFQSSFSSQAFLYRSGKIENIYRIN